jgi:hypothetical protein
MKELAKELAEFEANVTALARIEHEPEPEPVPEPVPAKQQSFDEILQNTDLSAANDNGVTLTRLRKAAAEAALYERLTPMFLAWIRSLENNFDLTFTDEQMRKMVNGAMAFFERRGLSPLSAKSYDTFRVHCSRLGLLPECYTEDELLAERVGITGELGFAERQDFSRESRRIQESRRQ